MANGLAPSSVRLNPGGPVFRAEVGPFWAPITRHYALTVKDNQEHLLEDIQQVLQKALDTDFAGLEHDTYQTRERGHGREEYRCYTVLHTTEGIRNADAWAKLTTIGMCTSERTVKGETTSEVRYFIGDKKVGAKYYALGLRHHWGIENNLHWQLDVNFDEDGNRVTKRNAAENLALLRRLTLTLLKAHPSKDSIAKNASPPLWTRVFLKKSCGVMVFWKSGNA